MERDERVYMLGEDIGVYGGAFKVTEGFIERFGAERVIDTPIAEETIVGMAVGSAMEGCARSRSSSTPTSCRSGFDEITTVLVALPLPLRRAAAGRAPRPSGGGVRASNVPLDEPRAVVRATPAASRSCARRSPSDAKGLLKSAIRDDNPILFLEHKWIYRRIKEQVPEDPDFLVPIGKADVKRAGDDVSIVTYGAMVHKALEAAENLAAKGISAEVVDLRTVYPLDEETVLRSIEKTSRALVLYESYRFLGIGAEVAAVIAEKAFEHLDAPVMRLAPPNHAGAVLAPARGRVPAAGGRHRGGGRPALGLVRRDAVTSIQMPQLGETIVEGTILKWLKTGGRARRSATSRCSRSRRTRSTPRCRRRSPAP